MAPLSCLNPKEQQSQDRWMDIVLLATAIVFFRPCCAYTKVLRPALTGGNAMTIDYILSGAVSVFLTAYSPTLSFAPSAS